MKKLPPHRSASLALLLGFLIGMPTGALLVDSGSALAQSEDRQKSFQTSVLYALSKLAVDTELNAKRIVELGDRLDDLEIGVEDLSAPRK